MQAPFIAYQRISTPTAPISRRITIPISGSQQLVAKSLFKQSWKWSAGLSQDLSQEVHADRVANGHQAGDRVARL
jgi:hypothetical protein